MKFWKRWLFASIVMIPIAGLSSCMIAFALEGGKDALIGLALWFGEAILFGAVYALDPHHPLFK